jgi:hypothetical protein
MRREDSSRRDSMKVAQYEVLGWRSKKTTRPGRDDRRLPTLVKLHTRGPGAKTLLSSLPGRTSLFALFPSTSYWATFIESLPPPPSWLRRTSRDGSSVRASKPYVDTHGRPQDERELVPTTKL